MYMCQMDLGNYLEKMAASTRKYGPKIPARSQIAALPDKLFWGTYLQLPSL